MAESLWRQVREWEATVFDPSCKIIDGMPHAPSVSNTSDRGILKHLDLFDEAESATKEADRIRKETLLEIRSLKFLDEIKVLTLRYIEDKSFGAIAEELDFSKPHIYRIHDEAVDKILE